MAVAAEEFVGFFVSGGKKRNKKKGNNLFLHADVGMRKGSGDHIVCERVRGWHRALMVIGNNEIWELIESRHSLSFFGSVPRCVLGHRAAAWSSEPLPCAC